MRCLLIAMMMLSIVGSPLSAHAASVVLDREEFVQLIANVDLLKKKLANADQQLILHVKAKGERDKIIALQQQQIGELEGIIQDHEAAGKSKDELIEALEQRYQQHAQTDLYQNVGMGVLAVALFVLAWVK